MPLYQRCVHLGCRVPFCASSKWFECPCHGSKYNFAGRVPARARRRAASTGSRSSSRAIRSSWTRPRSSWGRPAGPTRSSSRRRARSAWRRGRERDARHGGRGEHHRDRPAGPRRALRDRLRSARSCCGTARRPTAPRSRRRCGPAPPTRPSRRRSSSACRAGALVMVVFFVAWFPLQWLLEPGRNLAAGGGAEDPRDRAGRARRPPVHRGEPARGRVRALPRARAEGRRAIVFQGAVRTTRRTSPRSARGLTLGRDRRRRSRQGRPAGDAVVEHPLRGRAHRPADQRHRATTSCTSTRRTCPPTRTSASTPRGEREAAPPAAERLRPRARSLARGEAPSASASPEGSRPDAGAGDLSRLQHRVRRPREGRRRRRSPGSSCSSGSVYMLLAAVLGRWMGYLRAVGRVLGLDDHPELALAVRLLVAGPRHAGEPGPRGPEAAWTVQAAGNAICDDACRESEFAAFDTYPGGRVEAGDRRGAERTRPPGDPGRRDRLPGGGGERGARPRRVRGGRDRRLELLGRHMSIGDRVGRHADLGRRGALLGGGPATTIALYFDEGAVAVYGWMFLVASVILFVGARAAAGPRGAVAAGVPDRAARRRLGTVRRREEARRCSPTSRSRCWIRGASSSSC